MLFRSGLNYKKHAAESNSPLPPHPVLFIKNTASVQNPGDPIEIPVKLASTKVDYECELAVVIGRLCSEVPIRRVPEVVLGYTCANDVTARDLQATDGRQADNNAAAVLAQADAATAAGVAVFTIALGDDADRDLLRAAERALRAIPKTRRLLEGAFAEVEAVILAEDVEGAIPADGVEPGFEIVPHASWLGEVELEKRILHDIAATLDVSTEDAGCVGDKGAFMLVQRPPDQHGGFILYVWVGHARVHEGNEQTQEEIRPERNLRHFSPWKPQSLRRPRR